MRVGAALSRRTKDTGDGETEGKSERREQQDSTANLEEGVPSQWRCSGQVFIRKGAAS